LQRAVHRGDGDVESRGALGSRPAEYVSCDQDRPLPRRQVLDRSDERELDRLLGDDLGLWLGIAPSDPFQQLVRVRL
jgi:hypothetical protein